MAQSDADWDGQDAETDEVQQTGPGNGTATEANAGTGDQSKEKKAGEGKDKTPEPARTERPHPWRETNVPQIEANHPGTPGQTGPKAAVTVVVVDDQSLPKTLKEAFEELPKAENAFRIAKGDEARLKTWRRLRAIRKITHDLQQLPAHPQIGGAEFGKGHATHAEATRELKLKYAAQENLEVRGLLEERDALLALVDEDEDMELLAAFLKSKGLMEEFGNFARAKKAEQKQKQK